MGADREGIVARYLVKLREHGLRFRHGVERERRLVAAVAFFRRKSRVFFLQMGRIGEQHRAKFMSGGIRIDRAAIAVPVQSRQIAGVVNVRVRQQHPVNGRWIDRQLVPIALLQLLRAFEKPAIHQQTLALCFDKIFRAGNRACRAKESNFRHRADILDRIVRGTSVLFSWPNSLRFSLSPCPPRLLSVLCGKSLVFFRSVLRLRGR